MSSSGPSVPLPPLYVSFLSVGIYGLVLKAIQVYQKDKKPIILKWPFFIHNCLLCVISLILTLGIIFECLNTWINFGFYSLYCGTGTDWDFRLMDWGILFYYSKFYELLDTVFLALRKKHLSVLHLFHHVIVILGCWPQIQSEMYFGWITGINNAGIHVFMYYYYALQCLKLDVWWKKYLTKAQILQFIIDCTTSLPWFYFYLSGHRCRGDIRAWLFGNVVGFLLIGLFYDFFVQTYSNSRKIHHGENIQQNDVSSSKKK